MDKEKAQLFIGSPKGLSSTSAALGNCLLDKLEEKGLLTEVMHLHPLLKSEKGHQELLAKYIEADLIILSFPLYIDTLPAPVIRAFELIADNVEKKGDKRRKMIAIANCGFPEADHNRVALANCRQIAGELGIEWLGGLPLGMGGAISGRPINELGGMASNIKKSFDLVVDSILRGEKVSEEAIDFMKIPLLPNKWMYTAVAGFSWRYMALKNKVYRRLKDRPYGIIERG